MRKFDIIGSVLITVLMLSGNISIKAQTQNDQQKDQTYGYAESLMLSALDNEWSAFGLPEEDDEDENEGAGETGASLTMAKIIEMLPTPPEASHLIKGQLRQDYLKAQRKVVAATAVYSMQMINQQSKLSENYIMGDSDEDSDMEESANMSADQLINSLLGSSDVGSDEDDETEDDEAGKGESPLIAAAKMIGVGDSELKKISSMDEQKALKYVEKKLPKVVEKMHEIEAQKEADEKSKKRYDEISAEIDQMQNDDSGLVKMIENLSERNDVSELESELNSMRRQIIIDWPSSQECVQINNMEKELASKLDSWMKKEHKNYDDEYPEFWKESRKAQNVLVDQWNLKTTENWLNKVNAEITSTKDYMNKIVDIDNRLEALHDECGNDAVYGAVKAKSLFLSQMFLSYFVNLHNAVVTMPLADNVLEIQTEK